VADLPRSDFLMQSTKEPKHFMERQWKTFETLDC